MRAVVTGAVGFVGSHLVRALVERGDEVVAVDRRRCVEDRVLRPNRAQVFAGSVTEFCGSAWADGMLANCIFHLAACVGPADVIRDPHALLQDHEADIQAVLSVAKATGATVVFTSSSEVYGSRLGSCHESDECTLYPPQYPRSAYAISKLHCEALLLSQTDVPVVVTRLFNVVGAGQRPAFVLPIFVRAALRGLPIPMHGGGDAMRCLTSVHDTVTALIALAECERSRGQIVNVGAEAPVMSVRALARRVGYYVHAHYGVPVPAIEQVPYEQTGDAVWGRMKARIPNVDKLAKLTGLHFPDRWNEIMHEVVEYERAQLEAETIGAAGQPQSAA